MALGQMGDATFAGYARYAVYWAPPRGSDLERLGAAWLGWDPEAGAAVAQPTGVPNLAEHTAAPARYGFHATLKPPFRLTEGTTAADLDAALAALAATTPPATGPGLAIGDGLGFLAFQPGGAAPEFGRLAARVVEALETFRAPLTEDELARRRAAGLTALQDALLTRWGYPYVMEEFRFHLTLSGPISGLDAVYLANAARGHFAPAVAPGLALRELCLFGDPGEGGRFRLLARHALTG